MVEKSLRGESRSWRGTSFSPRTGSSTRVKVEAQLPQSQKCTFSRSGFSSNGAMAWSLAASEIEIISNGNNLPSDSECNGPLQLSLMQRPIVLLLLEPLP